MKLSTKKVLSLAAGSVMLAGGVAAPAFGNTYTWNSTASSDWLTAGNWAPATVPTSADLADFNSVVPLNNTVNIASPTNVGAILDVLTKTLQITGSTLTLFGQTVGVPQLGVTTNFNNVVLATGNSASGSNTLTVGSNLLLENSLNTMVGAQGAAGLGTSEQSLTINGAVSNATSTAAGLTLLGGGTPNNYGAYFAFNGANTYTGPLVIGNTAGTQGATGQYTPTSFPTTSSITVNEQSELLLSATGSYGVATQTLTLNGGGVGPGDSSGQSGALRNGSSAQTVFNPAFIVGTNTTGTHAAGFVVITSAGGSGTMTLTGAISGSGSIQKQGKGALVFADSSNTWTGGVQVGNGSVWTTATSSLGSGDLSLAASQASNTATVLLFNPTQSVRNLFSTYAGDSGSDLQQVELFGTALTVNATANHIFGYGPGPGLGLVSQIVDGTAGVHGSLIYSGAHGATLSLTGPNTYSGGTTVSGGTLNLANIAQGSATGGGNVEVKSGGELSSGGGVPQNEGGTTLATSGTMSGALIVDSGGVVSPGGDGLVGSLSVGSLTAHSGSVFDFDLAGGTAATADEITTGGALTLDNSGTETVNVAGSKLAFGTYTLATYGSLANAGTAFTLGSTPGGVNRSYSLTTTGTSLLLNILDTGSEYYWSVGGTNPTTDGGGTWQVGSNNFFSTNPNTAPSPYSNSTTFPVIIGNGGNGGTITVTGAVTVGGGLIFSNVNTPYTIAGTNTITLNGGIVASSSANISAPIALTGSENFQAAAGTTLSVTGGISDGGTGATLSIGGDTGTVVLGGSNSYSGGTVINAGTLQTGTGSLPLTGNVKINSSASTLVFTQATGGTYSGQITGSGSVAVNSPGATVALGNVSNSYAGPTQVQAGVLSIAAPGDINSGAGGISLQGGTLQFTAPMTFGTGSQLFNTASGTSSVDTDGNDVTLGFDLSGAGGNLTKIGAGTLTFNNLQPTRSIGILSVLSGTLSLDSAVAFSFAAPATTGGYTGDLVLGTGIGVRLQGGIIGGGGTVFLTTDGDSITSQAATSEIDNTISLNPNGQTSFTADIGANASNTLTIGGAITGDGNVDFTGGAGIVKLTGNSTYDGPTPGGGSTTTIDNGAAGEIQLDVNNALPIATNVHITNSGVLDVFGVTQTIGSLDSSAAPSTAIVTNNSSTNALLVIDGTKSTNFAGFIEDTSGIGGGALTIELGPDYTGTLNLNSSTQNTYAGGTVLNGGTLLLGTQGDQLLGTTTGGVTFGGGTLLLSSAWGSSRPITVNTGASTINGGGNAVSLTPASITWNGGTLNLTNAAASTLTQNGGTIAVTPGSTLGIDTGVSLAVNGTTDPFTDSSNSSHHVAIVNNGTLTVTGANVSVAGITGNGSLVIGDGSTKNTVQLATNSGGSTVSSLTINGNSSLDIANNHLIINYGTGLDPITSIAALLTSGYAHGTWNGPGINSSAAAATSTSYGVGYADAADAGNPAGLSSGTIEVKYTLLGDADLNGIVNGIDFGIVAANFNQGVSRWDQGDFDYNNIVNGVDFGDLAANFNQGTSGADTGGATAADWAALEAFAAANGLMADVPEPASFGLLAVGAAGLLARRRRKINH